MRQRSASRIALLVAHLANGSKSARKKRVESWGGGFRFVTVAAATLRLFALLPLEVFGHESGHILELGNVGRIDRHKRLVRFEACARGLQLGRSVGRGLDFLALLGERVFSADDFEQMRDTEVFQQEI